MRLLFRISDGVRHFFERRRWTAELALGVFGEDLAHRHLQRAGYRVVARNYRTASSGNEVDIVAWEGDRLAMVEVKTRASDETGLPERAVHERKRERIIRAAQDYARRADIEWDKVRFDVVAIVDDKPPRVVLHRDAFDDRTIRSL